MRRRRTRLPGASQTCAGGIARTRPIISLAHAAAAVSLSGHTLYTPGVTPRRSAYGIGCATPFSIVSEGAAPSAQISAGLEEGDGMREDARSGGSGTPDATAASGRVLVVDADAGIAATLGAVLRHGGCTVQVAPSAELALTSLESGPFDVVLIDLDENDSDAQAVVERAQQTIPATTVIVLTGYATLESALRALRRGVYDYLVKPVDVEELGMTLARAME